MKLIRCVTKPVHGHYTPRSDVANRPWQNTGVIEVSKKQINRIARVCLLHLIHEGLAQLRTILADEVCLERIRRIKILKCRFQVIVKIDYLVP